MTHTTRDTVEYSESSQWYSTDSGEQTQRHGFPNGATYSSICVDTYPNNPGHTDVWEPNSQPGSRKSSHHTQARTWDTKKQNKKSTIYSMKYYKIYKHKIYKQVKLKGIISHNQYNQHRNDRNRNQPTKRPSFGTINIKKEDTGTSGRNETT